MLSFTKTLSLLLLGGSALAGPVISRAPSDFVDDCSLLSVGVDINLQASVTLAQYYAGQYDPVVQLGLQADVFVGALVGCYQENRRHWYHHHHHTDTDCHGDCPDHPPYCTGGDCEDTGLCIIADINIIDPVFTQQGFLNGIFPFPPGIEADVFLSLLGGCCDEYNHHHHHHHGCSGDCGGDDHGCSGDNCPCQGNDCGGDNHDCPDGNCQNNGICVIADIEISNPFAILDLVLLGQYDIPVGLSVEVFVSLLGGCCDDYYHHHHGCPDGGCGNNYTPGCPTGQCGGNDDGICLIAGITIADPIELRASIGQNQALIPLGVEIDVFLALLDNCCAAEESKRNKGGH